MNKLKQACASQQLVALMATKRRGVTFSVQKALWIKLLPPHIEVSILVYLFCIGLDYKQMTTARKH